MYGELHLMKREKFTIEAVYPLDEWRSVKDSLKRVYRINLCQGRYFDTTSKDVYQAACSALGANQWVWILFDEEGRLSKLEVPFAKQNES
jgi:hypothetical protein